MQNGKPPLLIEAVAGLALPGAFGTALLAALADPASRAAAVICFRVTGSGLTFWASAGRPEDCWRAAWCWRWGGGDGSEA